MDFAQRPRPMPERGFTCEDPAVAVDWDAGTRMRRSARAGSSRASAARTSRFAGLEACSAGGQRQRHGKRDTTGQSQGAAKRVAIIAIDEPASIVRGARSRDERSDL